MPPWPRRARRCVFVCQQAGRQAVQWTRQQAEVAANILDDACELRNSVPHAALVAKGAACQLQLAVAHGGMGAAGEHMESGARVAANYACNLRWHEVKVLNNTLGELHARGGRGAAHGGELDFDQIDDQGAWRACHAWCSQDHFSARADVVPDRARHRWAECMPQPGDKGPCRLRRARGMSARTLAHAAALVCTWTATMI